MHSSGNLLFSHISIPLHTFTKTRSKSATAVRPTYVLALIIKGQNAKVFFVLRQPEEKRCNCRIKADCPLNGDCNASEIVYEATVDSNLCQKKYIGISVQAPVQQPHVIVPECPTQKQHRIVKACMGAEGRR